MGSPHSTLSAFSTGSGFEEDPFKNKDPFGGGGTAQVDPFHSEDPFKESKQIYKYQFLFSSPGPHVHVS